MDENPAVMPLIPAKVDPATLFLRQLRWPTPRRMLPPISRGAVTGVVLAGLVVSVRVFAGDNLHAVQPLRTYRAGQMKPDRLQQVIHDRGIRTVVNLRGYCGDFDWYADECRVTHDANVGQEDIILSAIRLPNPAEIRRLLEVLDGSEHPVLLHCRQGVDRTGLASVIVKLLEPGVSLRQARSQLSLAFGYVPFNGTEQMRRFFEFYGEWLEQRELVHSPEIFRHWATHEYCPGPCRAEMQFLGAPECWPVARRGTVRIRVTNSSIRDWMMRPGSNQGVHARYQIDCAAGQIVDERAGLFDARVAVGQAIELDLGVPPLPPGQYQMRVNMIDSDQNAFSQFGVEPAVWNFRVAN